MMDNNVIKAMSGLVVEQTISIRACEMIAEVRVLERHGAAPEALVEAELASMQAGLRAGGVTVTGRVW